MTIDLLSEPIITLSLDCSNSSMDTSNFPFLAESKAASLTKFAKSAPEKPGVLL